MIDWPLVGLGLAVVVEASHWLRLRWDFDDEALVRSWRLSVLGIAVAAVMILIDGQRYTALPSLLSWLPALLLPVQFVQSYGMRSAVPLSEFSMLAKQQRKRNERFGLGGETRYLNFGNVIFVAALIGATIGNNSRNWIFLPAMITLIGWKLMSGANRLLLPLMLACVCGLALAGEFGLRKLSDWVGAGLSSIQAHEDPDFNSTMIGSQGQVRQSPDIIWRVRPDPGSPAPPLLRTNSFSVFLGANWRNAHVSAEERRPVDAKTAGDSLTYVLRPAGLEKPWKPASFNLRGSMRAEAPLPLPGDVAELRLFDFQSLQSDGFGRIHALPREAVISGTVIWRGVCNPEGPPIPDTDLRVSKADQETIRAIVAQVRLAELSTSEKVAELRRWFHNHFAYTRNLTIRRPAPRSEQPGALSQFLTTSRAGHCEYFATAAVMLLREAGVPARYAVGFAVVERDRQRGEFLIRGTHGHAWCRYWDEESGLWMDFDATPPDGSQTGMSGPGLGLGQRLKDGLMRIREDFFLWRNQSSVQMTITVVMALVGVGALVVIFRRLWRSKRTIHHSPGARRRGVSGRTIPTPLHSLERKATAILGPRPPGLPYARWLVRLAPHLADPARLNEALALHQRLRFDPVPLPQSDREHLTIITRVLAEDLKQKRKRDRKRSVDHPDRG
jgi:protein-glutamine gamma-glutamyltransferase